jgi:SPP1 family predicted phage head-tail adaptor
MKAGKMVHVIEILTAGESVDEYGTPTATWTALSTLRAEIIEQTTTEFIRTSGASDEAVMIFRTRYLAGVTNAERVQFSGRTFNIKQVTPLGRRKGLELRCLALEVDS